MTSPTRGMGNFGRRTFGAGLSRRHFLTLSAAAVGSILTRSSPSLADGDTPAMISKSFEGPPAERVDVVVIGAGLSGLVAARDLVRRGAKVRVLEARSRVGGRTLSVPLANGKAIADLGGQWIGESQHSILGLMDELGIGRSPAYEKGEIVGDLEDEIGMLAGLDYLRAAKRLDDMAAQVSLASPWTTENALALDAVSVGQWIDDHTYTSVGSELLKLEVRSSLVAPAKEVSLLYFLFHVHSAGGYDSFSNGASTATIDGGAQGISKKLAQELGDRVMTGAPVSGIRWDGVGARIRTAGALFEAKHVVVAMMPRDVERIAFFPELPKARQALQRNWTAPASSKFHCVYPTAFWREAGLNGFALSQKDFIAMAFDSSPRGGSPGMVTGFPADEGAMPTDLAERKRGVIESYVEFYGPQAAQPIAYAEKIWADDPFSAGCFAALEPGVLTRWGSALREPIGQIHWAGTETSEVWCGTMDGAVRAGARVASEVLAALRAESGQ